VGAQAGQRGDVWCGEGRTGVVNWEARLDALDDGHHDGGEDGFHVLLPLLQNPLPLRALQVAEVAVQVKDRRHVLGQGVPPDPPLRRGVAHLQQQPERQGHRQRRLLRPGSRHEEVASGSARLGAVLGQHGPAILAHGLTLGCVGDRLTPGPRGRRCAPR
jgi:hypothetical protein